MKKKSLDQYEYNLIKFILDHTDTSIEKIARMSGRDYEIIRMIQYSPDFNFCFWLTTKGRNINVKSEHANTELGRLVNESLAINYKIMQYLNLEII